MLAKVAKALESTGRTDAMCRNRYTRIKAPMKAGVECKNRCKRCGQMKRGHTCLTPEEQRAAERKAGSAGFIPSGHKPSKKERRQLHEFRDKYN